MFYLICLHKVDEDGFPQVPQLQLFHGARLLFFKGEGNAGALAATAVIGLYIYFGLLLLAHRSYRARPDNKTKQKVSVVVDSTSHQQLLGGFADGVPKTRQRTTATMH